MSSLFTHNRTMVRMSLLLPAISVFLLMALAPGRAHASTYAAVIALVVGIGRRRVEHMETRSAGGQPASGTVYRRSSCRRHGSAWQRWVAAGDRSDARGRARAGFALSVAITAVIVYVVGMTASRPAATRTEDR